MMKLKMFKLELPKDDNGEILKLTTSSSSKKQCLKSISNYFLCPENHIKITEIKGGK